MRNITQYFSQFVPNHDKLFWMQFLLVAVSLFAFQYLFAPFLGFYQNTLLTLGAYVESVTTAVQFEVISGELTLLELLLQDSLVQIALWQTLAAIVGMVLATLVVWNIFAPWLFSQSRKFTLLHSLLWMGIYLIYTIIFFFINLRFSLVDKVILNNATPSSIANTVDVLLLFVFVYFFLYTYLSQHYFKKATQPSVLLYIVSLFILFCLNVLLMVIFPIFQSSGLLLIYFVLSFAVLSYALAQLSIVFAKQFGGKLHGS